MGEAFFLTIPLAVLTCLVLGVVAFFRVTSLKRELEFMRAKLNSVMSRLTAAEGRLREMTKAERILAVDKKEEVQEAPAKEEEPEIWVVEEAEPVPAQPSTLKQTMEARMSSLPVKGTGPVAETVSSANSESKEKAPERKVAKPSFESVIGQRWMTWVGVGILFFSAAFFLKYAFENDLIGPTGQVVLCALAGVGVLVAGTRFIGKGMRSLGQGLMGLGLAILYVTFAASASSIYNPPVLTQVPAFLLLVAVTVCGMTLAILHNAPPIAILAVLGGLATPLLVSTGNNSRDALFTYLLLLDLGVLGVAFFRSWRVLDAITIAGTYFLYSGWFGKYYDEPQLDAALLWLLVFYFLFLMLPFVFHLVKKTPVALERFILALVNAVFTFGFMWYMLHEKHQQILGFISVAMAVIYLTMGTIFRRRLPADSKTLFGAVTLAVTFTTMAIPLHLHAHGITLAWAVEGPVLLYLGYRFSYLPVRLFGGVVLLLSVGRLFYAHWPLHHELYVPFINRHFISAMLVPVAMGLYAVIQHKFGESATIGDRITKLFFALGGWLLALLLVQYESCLWLHDQYDGYTDDCAASAIWMAGSLCYLFAGKKTRSMLTWAVGCFALFVSFIHFCIGLEASRAVDSLPFINLRFAVGVAFVLCVLRFARVVSSAPMLDDKPLPFAGTIFWGLGIFLLFGLFSYEVPTYVSDSLGWPGSVVQISLTLTWGLYASALLAVGFWRRVRPLRYCSLGLFGISALKLLIWDMDSAAEFLRIIAFMLVGLLMLAASYSYHRLEKRLSGEEPKKDDDNSADKNGSKDETSDQ
ncbi:MAG: DUF2339 domain-containing protein [Planctomycetes bacterium]|nr:DUF2339 domain-containing protein [Planctomycetota bacterium]